MFKLNRKNGVSYYTITSFEETVLVKHGFSTREGGAQRRLLQQYEFSLSL